MGYIFPLRIVFVRYFLLQFDALGVYFSFRIQFIANKYYYRYCYSTIIIVVFFLIFAVYLIQFDLSIT